MNVRLFNLVEPVVPLFPELATVLGDEGYGVEAVVSTLDYREGRSPLERQLDERATVRYVGGRGRLRGRRRHRLEMNLRYVFGVAGVVLSARSGTVNVVLSQPPGVQAVVVLLARIRGQRTIVHVMDVYPEVLVAAGMLGEASVVRRLWSALMHVTFGRADAVVAIGECMAHQLISKGAPEERTQVIRNWASTFARPAAAELGRQRNELVGSDDVFIVGYAGNMGVAHDFASLIEAARRFQERRAPVHFLLSGDGVRRAELEAAIRDLELRNVTLRGFVPEGDLGAWLAIPHVHFVSLRSAFSGLVVPSKVYGALAAGRPVIYEGAAATDIGVDLERTGAGVCTRDANDLESEVWYLATHRREYESMAEAAVRLAGERDAASAMDAYRALVKLVARETGGST